jgi:ribose transport system ATP-binding protein
VSFTLHGGEVLGVAGLLGSGSESLPYALFGALGGARGAIASRGWSGDASRLTPRRAIAAGFALVPADRQHQSAVGGLSVEKNLLSLVFDDFWSRGMLSHRRIRKAADERIRTFRVRPPNAALDMVSLSGGNQQKVVLARWLERHPSVLLLHEPTQGVDVTTRAEIYRIVENLTARGTAVVWVTTDFSELAAVSDRILIIGAGVVVRELHGPPISRDDISAAVYATKARVATDAS